MICAKVVFSLGVEEDLDVKIAPVLGEAVFGAVAGISRTFGRNGFPSMSLSGFLSVCDVLGTSGCGPVRGSLGVAILGFVEAGSVHSINKMNRARRCSRDENLR